MINQITDALKLIAVLPDAVKLVAEARVDHLYLISKTAADRAIPVAKDKPRLRRISGGKWKWWCHDDTLFSTWAATPQEAYAAWAIKKSSFTRIKRFGCWNAKDCRKWASDGCKPMSYWIGNKQIAGYDFDTDELILRG